MLKKVPIVVLNRLKPSKIILGFQMTIKSSGRSFVDSLNRATKINKVVNRLMVAIGALMHAEIFKIVVKKTFAHLQNKCFALKFKFRRHFKISYIYIK